MLEHPSNNIEEPLRDLVDAYRFREALSLFLEWCEGPGEVTPQAQLMAAHAASRIGEFELAGSLAAAAQLEFRARGDDTGVIDCANLLGATAFERGHIAEAEVQFRSVVQMAESGGHARFTARSANNLAVIAHLRGEVELAMALYRKALDAFHRLADEQGIVETWHNLALTQRESGWTADALGECNRAVQAAERLGAAGLLALTLLGRAELFIASGAFDQAASDIERARHLGWLEGSEPHVLESERLLALLALRRGQPEEAHRHAELTRARAAESGFAQIAAESASIAALALKADRRLSEAAAANDLAVASLAALGATGLLQTHARAWRATAA